MPKSIRLSISPVLSFALVLGAATTPVVLTAQDVIPARENVPPPKAEYSPYADDHFPNRVFFGDTHLHTSWSTDVGMAGATLGPDVAYRVSRGEEVTSHLGWRVKSGSQIGSVTPVLLRRLPRSAPIEVTQSPALPPAATRQRDACGSC